MEWRLVANQVATLTEVREYYDLVDLLDANTALDLMEEASAPDPPPPTS
jgi:hypothetical protein